jgi:glycerol-3-phosphate acyltransferase PlsY
MSYGLVLALIFGYLLGSIPFGLLITRAAGLGDVRKLDSYPARRAALWYS